MSSRYEVVSFCQGSYKAKDFFTMSEMAIYYGYCLATEFYPQRKNVFV